MKKKRKTGMVDLHFGHVGEGLLYAAPAQPEECDRFKVVELVLEKDEDITKVDVSGPENGPITIPPGKFYLVVNDQVLELKWNGEQLRDQKTDHLYFDVDDPRNTESQGVN
jgi:hypothetical protein